jgi:lipopolysaccharide transport system permease protein
VTFSKSRVDLAQSRSPATSQLRGGEPRVDPVHRLAFVIEPFRMLFRHRELLVRTTASELRQRYAGFAIGLVWMVLSPLLFMALYSVVYIGVFRIQPSGLSTTDYVLYMFSGLIPLIGFVEGLVAGTTSLSANRAVLLNTVFPAELVPVRAVFVSHVTTLCGLSVLILAAAMLGHASPTLLLVPICLVLQVMFVSGIALLLSLVNLAFRDIQQLLGFVAMILLIASPVSYTPDMVPARLLFVIYLNPFSYFVLTLHDVVLGRWPAISVMVASLLGLTSFCVGFAVFRRVKQVFLDYA